ncbi:MAG: cytochrome c biogenesis protein ResB [Spirochaetaceae bacterium]
MRKIIKILSSMRLAVVLLVLIIVLSIIATLIPQGQEDAYYIDTYGEALGSLIVNLHLYSFYLSPLFLLPGVLFFLNLLVCTIKRLSSRIRNRAPARFGPDIVHVSLLLIMVLGIYSLYTRQEVTVFLSRGDSVVLENGLEIRLKEFESLSYADGSPKDWISRVEIFLSGEKLTDYAIEVNKPYSYGPYKVFQSTFMDETGVVEEGLSGEKLGATSYTGLKIVKMPATTLILLTLLLFCVGLALTFYQKLGEKKR